MLEAFRDDRLDARLPNGGRRFVRCGYRADRRASGRHLPRTGGGSGRGWGIFTVDEPDVLRPYRVDRVGELSEDLVAAVSALTNIPDPGTLGFM